MSNTYIWSIAKDGLITVPILEGQSDVILHVIYLVTGTDGTHTTSLNNIAHLKYTPGGSFTPFAELTQAQVIGWVQASQPNLVQKIQTQIDQQLYNIANPQAQPRPQPAPWTCSPTTISNA